MTAFVSSATISSQVILAVPIPPQACRFLRAQRSSWYATDVGTVDRIIMPIRDAAAIAENIDRMAADAGLVWRMALAAQCRPREFSWEKYSRRFIDAIIGGFQ